MRAHGFEVAHGAATFAYVGRSTVPRPCVNVALAAVIPWRNVSRDISSLKANAGELDHR